MPLFGKGFRIGAGADQDRWIIVKKLGEGQFAEVYEVKDTQDAEKRCALKIERRRDVRSVKQEFKVLKKIQERAPSMVCTVHACGTFEDRFFMVMELLGSNVAEARKAAGGRFDLATVRHLACSMLRGLEQVHATGFVHRDVKPANFAVGPAFADALTGRERGMRQARSIPPVPLLAGRSVQRQQC
ncbi:putative serine/threonine-protein kinase [Tetrabaena socialis]|uniref:Putative serine/threonine-protein kinase n=1 Tax=Tetrabaena socialis TaxID=47790 RepID=A0A2J8ABV6_9CHLO|nr:putative serine/threonine-protein kinase [Tetrabaena socialis]|eukprot:PNH10000.1 putative serine/threonine-protein kinase [Tetrabaena socialis]